METFINVLNETPVVTHVIKNILVKYNNLHINNLEIILTTI